MTPTPEELLWAALEQHECRPRGHPWKGSSLCPSHDDREPSLVFGAGGDGRAVLFCHAGCRTEDVLAALEMQMTDLFPVGHRLARQRRLPTSDVRLRGAAKTIADVLAAVDQAGQQWQAMLAVPVCAYCGGRALMVANSAGGVSVDCAGGEELDCNAASFSSALAQLAAEAKGAR